MQGERSQAISARPQGVHLVGSVPLASAEDVFRAAGSILGNRLHRVPDGETGVRSNWIGWQIDFLMRNPSFEFIPPDPDSYAPLPSVKLRSQITSNDISFDNLGYADAALASYALFTRLKQEGLLPLHYRFQVSLPTPLATVSTFVAPQDQAVVEPAYEHAMLAELDRIMGVIPHDELAVQWDVAVEFGILENVTFVYFAKTKQVILERLMRLGNYVPTDVQLGYHLCYGDAGHKHFKEPQDTSKLVEVANALFEGVKRPINWIHMPVPRDRDDEAYFAPLRTLHLRPETELYLGVVHYTDGVEGTQRRIAAAQRVIEDFGVATECGMGRRAPDTIPDLLHIHREVSAPVE